jgi:pimeloyl-ACP methyl ester carboxylesterase
MQRRTVPRHALILSLVGLSAAVSEALEITDQVQAAVESCTPATAGYFQAPPDLLDCTVRPPCITNCLDPNCARLVPGLRSAAQTRDAREILVRAALEYYVLRRPELGPLYSASPRVAQALADLAVTGQAAYATFRDMTPTESALVGPLSQRLRSAFPTHSPVPSDVSGAVHQALHRSYQVVWALRGPTPYRNAQRAGLGWIAVEGEDDPPHRPVNIPATPYPQYNMTVRVRGIDVTTRYMVASRDIADDHPVDIAAIPADPELPLIIGDVVLFIHGHSSSVEEAVTLAGPLLAQAADRGRPVTLIAMDLPSNGYASMLEHTTVAPADASLWNTGYPILDFIEDFVIAFVDGLDARQPGIKGQIVGVIGGSLGGNMTLRLARRDPAVYPWLRTVVSWSPASSWPSWARAVIGIATRGRFYDLEKFASVHGTNAKMRETEINDGQPHDSLHSLFHETVLGRKVGRVGQADHWYSKSWPCREAAMTASHRALYEIYNARFRRWHWRVAHEQVIFSHWDSDLRDLSVDPDPRYDPRAGPARYSTIKSRLFLAAGYDDNFEPELLFSETKALAGAMTMIAGQALLIRDTGHSIHVEKPGFFADRILTFLYAVPPPPFPAFLVPAVSH